MEHVFESPAKIISSLKSYYTNETLKQIYKIIGSLDFVGNPTILLSSFMSGVKDLVAAPTAAFMKSPANVKNVGIGVGIRVGLDVGIGVGWTVGFGDGFGVGGALLVGFGDGCNVGLL